MTQSLFEPYRLGDLHLPNRILMTPMTRKRAAKGKLPTALMVVASALRQVSTGSLILAGKHDAGSANAAIASDAADPVAFGEAFLANPDLPARFRLGVALNPADRAAFYTDGERGYTDDPTLIQD